MCKKIDEQVNNVLIDDIWERRRYELTKEVLIGVVNDPKLHNTLRIFSGVDKYAVDVADGIIERLKK